jgi:hypothetical protein
MAGEARDEEATWRDLVAQYSTPVAADGVVPWPVREELSTAQQAPPGAPGPAGAPGSTDTSMDTTDAGGASAAPGTPGPGDPGTGREAGTGSRTGTGGEAGTGRGTGTGSGTGTGEVAGGTGGQAGPRADGEDPGAAQPPPRGWDPVPGVIPVQPQSRIVRPAASAPLPPGGDDEHYVPPVPPPLPRLDPVSKGAWVALFGGPGYLLLAVLLGWVVPSWIAFCAVGAFVGGFATLVVRMGDRPPGDSGPDDGAVV